MNFYFLSYSIYTLSFLFQLISLLALEAYVWLKMFALFFYILTRLIALLISKFFILLKMNKFMFALYFCPNEEMELMNQMLGY